MVSKCGHLILPGAFPDKVSPDNDFKDEAALLYDVTVVRMFLQVPVIYKRSQINFDVNT